MKSSKRSKRRRVYGSVVSTNASGQSMRWGDELANLSKGRPISGLVND
jgi:hypothetical protein